MNLAMHKRMYKNYLVFFFCLIAVVSARAQEILTDPTRPALYAETNSVNLAETVNSEFRVSQIYTDAKKRLATINGQKVSIGEWVDGAQVIAINATSVDLLVDDEKRKISIIPSFKMYKKLPNDK